VSELRRNIQINGETYHLAVNQYGAGEPGSSTPGKPGVLYMDTENGELYKCRTADTGNRVYGWEKIGTGSVGSWKDLTDKPFVPEKVYYEWDEDTEYTTVVPSLEGMTFTQLARISEDAPSSDFFLGKSVDVHGIGETGHFHSVVLLRIGAIQQYSTDVYVVSGGAMAYYVCTGTSANLEGMTITKGIWCMDGWKEPLFDLIITEMRLIDPAVTLDESVIPDSVARISDVTEMITDALGVIENGTY